MTTQRAGKPFALSCLLAMLFTQSATIGAEVVPIGRRREKAAQQAPGKFPAQNQARPIPTEPVLAEGVRPGNAAPQVAPRDGLQVVVEKAISKTSQRYLDADEHTPWQIMHGVVALRRDFELTRGDGTVNCIEFLSNAPTFRGEQWFHATRHGGCAHPFSVPYAFEGHANQFLALLSMSNLPLTHEFTVAEGRIVTMADMLRNAKMSVNSREEITWTLWFLTHYLDIDAEWTNENGEPWSIEELVRLQTDATVTTAPCGGTHGLFAIAYARNAFLQKHGRLQGIYLQADQKIQRHIELARSLQNYDGSFSAEFFKGPGHSRDFNERLKASGHMLEWLMMALPQRRLNEGWVRRAVASISTDLVHNAAQPAKCGPLYHALNSLIMYRDRVNPRTTPSEHQAEPELAVDPGPIEEPSESAPQPAEPPQIMPMPKIVRDEAPTETPSPTLTADSTPDSTPEEPRIPAEPVLNPPPPKRNELAKKAGARLAEIATRTNSDPDAGEASEPESVPTPGTEPRRIAIESGDSSVR